MPALELDGEPEGPAEPPARAHLVGDQVFVVQGLLSPAECEAYIRASERTGYDEAPVNTGFGEERLPDVRDNGERSFFTFMIYLNGGFEGGETSFAPDSRAPGAADLRVTPAPGLALFFVHPYPHKGEPVQRGRKYVLRTDVMYAPVGPWELP